MAPGAPGSRGNPHWRMHGDALRPRPGHPRLRRSSVPRQQDLYPPTKPGRRLGSGMSYAASLTIKGLPRGRCRPAAASHGSGRAATEACDPATAKIRMIMTPGAAMPHQKRPSALATRGSTSALRIEGTVVETQAITSPTFAAVPLPSPTARRGPGVHPRANERYARTGSRRWCGPSPWRNRPCGWRMSSHGSSGVGAIGARALKAVSVG